MVERKSKYTMKLFRFTRRGACAHGLLVLLIFLTILLSAGQAFSATFTVNDSSDTDHGNCFTPCSLRDAINASNGVIGPNIIQFAIAGVGVKTIKPTTTLPAITQPVTIDGTTQDTNSSTPVIEIDGSLTTSGSGLIFVTGSDNSVVKGLIINRFLGAGLEITGPGSITMEFNWIGLNSSGDAAASNQAGGILLTSSSNNQIGGVGANQRNVISGNGAAGITMADSGSQLNTVVGNYIGTDIAGSSAVPNTNGIFIASNSNTIGGNGSGNVIAFNTGAGVLVDSGQGNLISGNNIFSNGELGIDLLPTSGAVHGVTANDADDSDSGANGLQNFPVFTASIPSAGQLQIDGTLQSTPNSTFTIEYFYNSAADGSGNGEGENFLGAASGIMTDGSGQAPISSTLSHTVANGETITVTIINESDNNTSEFSASVVPAVPTATPTPTPTATQTATSTPTVAPTPQPQKFKDGARIVDPPVATVQDRTVTIVLAKFSIPKKQRLELEGTKKAKGTIQYEVSLFNAAKKLLKTQISKRNVLTFKNLKPGNYTVSYVANLVMNKQVVGKTRKSPAVRFTVT